ncbi:MAG: dTDP-4-dehydrorhamnose reductase [Agarilytica sp.]
MKVLVTGAGQLAWELARTCPADVELVTLPRAELDISEEAQVASCIEKHQPDAVINAAAYTAVDKAEQERDVASAVNENGPKFLAKYCQQAGAYFLHVSTDFVFDGSASRPYSPDSPKSPLGVYGETKSAGEDAIAEQMDKRWAVIRTAWVYSSHGNNFVKTMLRLMDEKPALGVVGDQVGTPTWAKGLAEACWAALDQNLEGVYHWTDTGVASWYDFAIAIQRLGLSLGLLDSDIPINSIATEDYPTPAKRPSYSVLDKKKILEALPVKAVHWQDQLQLMMAELKAQ